MDTASADKNDLKDYWVFLARRGLDWREVRLEDIGEFVAWLRLPPSGRSGEVAVLPSVQAHVCAATVNRKLSALAAFYAYQARHGVDVGDLLVTWQPGQRGGWKPFLHHVSKGKLQPRRTIALKAPAKLPRILTTAETQAILDACEHLRDRFLCALLYDSGVRVGEALGMRHEDVAAADRAITIVPRANDNGARTKSRQQRTVPVGAPLIRLWADYLATELAAILDAHQDLPVIAWTVGPAGPVLAGQVSGLAEEARVREVFGAWRLALALDDYREHRSSAGTAWLCAASRRHQVNVRLTANVFEDEG